tara:strand:- start:727 stop:1440 length:714 start_codon:yes stop_codon:yes gene_type:complete
MGTSGASDNSEEKVVNIEVRDSVIGEFEVSQIKKMTLSDSVINISIPGSDELKSISEVITEYRREIRKLHRGEKSNGARGMDYIIAELSTLIKEQRSAGLVTVTASLLSLQALTHARRGRIDLMNERIEEALELDPHCEQAHLVAGEYSHNLYLRMDDELKRVNALQNAIIHHKDVWGHGSSKGARNNAGYHLCLELLADGKVEQARALKEELLQSISNSDGITRVEAIEIPSQSPE